MITKKDAFGDRGITLLGDSISHGANALDIAKNGYVAHLKRAIGRATASSNYGFTSVEGALENPYGKHIEMHDMPQTDGSWEFRRGSQFLGTRAFCSAQQGDALTFTVRDDFRFFCVYYHTAPDGGRFSVGTDGTAALCDVGGSDRPVDTHAATERPARTAFYDFSALKDRRIHLTVESDGKPVILTGIGYYNDPEAVVLNNYANSGLLLTGYEPTGSGNGRDVTGLDVSILELAAQSEQLIFAIGYNDSHAHPEQNYEDFTFKLNYLIDAVRRHHTKVVVNDLCWYFSPEEQRQVQYYKDELKRLADETGGLYVDQQAIHGDEILRNIDDTAHPNPTGHRLIAEALIAAMGL